jgi:hypothetical protein
MEEPRSPGDRGFVVMAESPQCQRILAEFDRRDLIYIFRRMTKRIPIVLPNFSKIYWHFRNLLRNPSVASTITFRKISAILSVFSRK